MIFRAKVPRKGLPKTTLGRLTNCKSTYNVLPDDLYNEAYYGISITNSINCRPLFPKYSKYVFAICDNKPLDTDTFKWEGMPNEIDGKRYRICKKGLLGDRKNAEAYKNNAYRLHKLRKYHKKREQKKLCAGIPELRGNSGSEETTSTEE